MKKKIIIGSIIAVLIIGVIYVCLNISTEKEQNVENVIEPQIEIEEKSEIMSNIKLYFIDAISGVINYEERKINAKELVDNPYKCILNLLIQGPNSNTLKNTINKQTKINNIKFEKGILTIDLSKEFLETGGTEGIYSIVNTMTEFNEVEKIRFLIDGKIKEGMSNEFTKTKSVENKEV